MTGPALWRRGLAFALIVLGVTLPPLAIFWLGWWL